MTYNVNEIALNLLNAHKNHLPLSLAAPQNILKQVIKITSQYQKNNPVMYVLNFSEAKIIETTQAEYDLSLAKQGIFSKPYPERKDIIHRLFKLLNTDNTEHSITH